jgi:hypothetical protein
MTYVSVQGMMPTIPYAGHAFVRAHERSARNRPDLTGRVGCGCFHCRQVYAAEEIADWADDGQTAICPRCGVDAVLSARTDPLMADFLARMHARWFG